MFKTFEFSILLIYYQQAGTTNMLLKRKCFRNSSPVLFSAFYNPLSPPFLRGTFSPYLRQAAESYIFRQKVQVRIPLKKGGRGVVLLYPTNNRCFAALYSLSEKKTRSLQMNIDNVVVDDFGSIDYLYGV